jgi:hypothetical protein
VERLLHKYELPVNKLACSVRTGSPEVTESENGVPGSGLRNVTVELVLFIA